MAEPRIVKIPKKRKTGGGSKKDRQHMNHVLKYQRQRARTTKNKWLAWEKHLKNHPNDVANQVIIKKLLANI